MEYNNEKTIETIKLLAHMIQSDASELSEISLTQSNDELDRLWRICEMIESYADEARILVGKITDEREDMEAEDEGE
jgi:hypothetical protein